VAVLLDQPIEVAPLVLPLTRPTLTLGIPRGAFVFELVLVAMIFLNLRSPLAWLIFAPIHAVFYVVTIRDPYYLSILMTKMRKCARSQNKGFWGGNSYAP
jgi:type IV secretion system protein VirB3